MFGTIEGLEVERPRDKMIVMVIDTEKERPQLIKTEGGLDEWYRLINCDLIDVQVHTIEGKPFDFICDDEALFKEGGKVSALDKDQQPVMVGNLVICNCDDEGRETGLQKRDIELLKHHICILSATQELKDRTQSWAAVYGLDT